MAIGLSSGILFVVVPAVIAQAYRGESLSILNAMIRGQALFPLEHYFQVWRETAVRILVVEAAFGLLLAFLTWPVVQRGVDRGLGGVTAPAGAALNVRMSRKQLIVANCVVLVLLGLQILDIAMQREDWPFSNYPMYASQQTEHYSWIRVYGVAETGEFALAPERQLRPWDFVRINYSFAGTVLSQPDQSTSGRRALESLYRLYEAGRRAGEHNGPPLRALRVYREQWRIEPELANKATPEERQLIYELNISD
ncbi:MAG TPA: hypothetical protein VJX92_21590 [Methylomirabilota bacterium]|nr:hypothetical protein [Methylomirabilota bacterium]